MMINLTRPRFVIPYHGEPRHALSYADMSEQMGYKRDEIPVHAGGRCAFCVA
jgi:ribonuclease J